MGDGAHDHYSSRKQPNISPGARQKHSHEILNTIKSVRDNLERLEEYVRKFELQEDVIPAIVLNYIDRDISVINYKVGQANGALVLPDMRD